MTSHSRSRVAAATGRSYGLGARLLLAQAMVLLAGVCSTAVIAAVIGPPLFREHLHQAGVPANSLEEAHAEQAYAYATAISVGGALAVSVLAALAVSWYVSRRLHRSVAEVASAAGAVARGHYEIRVSSPHLGDDFDILADSFNQMAARLQTVEQTRRQMFGDLAHEIRTPIAVLQAYIEAVGDGVRPLNAETTDVLDDQARRLVRFSADLSALATAEESSSSLDCEWIRPADLIHTAVTAAQGRFGAEHVWLKSETAEDLPPLWGDPQRLLQVLGNLFDNALRHSDPGGSVRIRAAAQGHSVVISVVDRGSGIAPQHLERVFERFYRTDSARARDQGGAGIGLAIAKAIVEAHGGTISVTSPGIGAGATFTIALPAADRADIASIDAHPAG
jgi:signal transduction histidine kinase